MIIALFLVAIYTNTNAQTYIWGGPGDKNSEFDGGLNDWTTEGFTADNACANPQPNDDAAWEWSANGATKGAITGSNGRPVIESPSINNGAAVFDSDFKDNDGKRNNDGGGKAPIHQLGYLTSPSFSCKDHNTVVVRFNHARINFYSDFYLDVSIDGGNLWERIDLNGDEFTTGRIQYAFNRNDPKTVEVIDISSIAANQEDVKIRFTICGNYYYWVIDDVYVMEQVEDNLVLGDCFYPTTNYARPSMSLSNDTAYFACFVANVGTADNAEVTVQAAILDVDANQIVWSTEKKEAIAAGDTLKVIFDEFYLTANLDENKVYGIVYRINNQDYNTTDNLYARAMIINDGEEYQKLDKTLSPNVGYRPRTAQSYAFGLPFQTGTLGGDYIVTSIESGIVTSAAGLTDPDNVLEAYLLEFNTNDPYFNNEDFFNAEILTIDADNDFYNVVGYGVKAFTEGVENWNLFEIPMENDVDPDLPLRLKADKLYMVALHVVQAGSDNIWVLFSLNQTEMHNYQTIFPQAQLSYLTYNDDAGWRGAFGNVNTPPYCTVALKYDPVATKAPELPETSVQVSPNPASDRMIVDYNFKEATSGELVLTTNDGKVINRRSLNKTQSGHETYDVTQYPSGQYMMHIKTEIGYKTVPVVIQK